MDKRNVEAFEIILAIERPVSVDLIILCRSEREILGNFHRGFHLVEKIIERRGWLQRCE